MGLPHAEISLLPYSLLHITPHTLIFHMNCHLHPHTSYHPHSMPAQCSIEGQVCMMAGGATHPTATQCLWIETIWPVESWGMGDGSVPVILGDAYLCQLSWEMLSRCCQAQFHRVEAIKFREVLATPRRMPRGYTTDVLQMVQDDQAKLSL